MRLRIRDNPYSLLAEVVLIVVGINVALWFEGWFQDQEDRAIEVRYLVDLKADLESDIDALAGLITWAERKSTRAREYIVQLPDFANLQKDQLARAVNFPSSYQFFTPSDFTYRSMQESGDFRLLTDEGIKRGILRLDRRHGMIKELQTNYLRALDDIFLPLMMRRFDLATGELTDASLLEDQLFLNFFAYVANDTATMAQLFR